MSDRSSGLFPFYLGWKGGETIDAIQCMAAGDNGYHANQAAYNRGLNNAWATKNTPWSWGYYKREDIPAQFAIAEGWTSADMYQVRNLPGLWKATELILFRNLKSLQPTPTA